LQCFGILVALAVLVCRCARFIGRDRFPQMAARSFLGGSICPIRQPNGQFWIPDLCFSGPTLVSPHIIQGDFRFLFLSFLGGAPIDLERRGVLFVDITQREWVDWCRISSLFPLPSLSLFGLSCGPGLERKHFHRFPDAKRNVLLMPLLDVSQNCHFDVSSSKPFAGGPHGSHVWPFHASPWDQSGSSFFLSV